MCFPFYWLRRCPIDRYAASIWAQRCAKCRSELVKREAATLAELFHGNWTTFNSVHPCSSLAQRCEAAALNCINNLRLTQRTHTYTDTLSRKKNHSVAMCGNPLWISVSYEAVNFCTTFCIYTWVCVCKCKLSLQFFVMSYLCFYAKKSPMQSIFKTA